MSTALEVSQLLQDIQQRSLEKPDTTLLARPQAFELELQAIAVTL